MINGNGLSYGIAIGKVLVLKPTVININDDKIDDVSLELNKLDKYLNDVIDDTSSLIEKLDGSEKEIMEAHLLILQDPTLVEETKRLINDEKYNVLYAIDKGFDTVIQMFEAIEDEYLKARSRDIADLKKRVLEKACAINKIDLSSLEENTILVSYELTTSDTAQLDFLHVAGIITEIGGVTSHSCIMAKNHSIPAISGIKDIYNIFKDGDKLALNGENGEIYINPTNDIVDKFLNLKNKNENEIAELNKFRGITTKTKDGKVVKLYANIGNSKDCSTALSNDCEGIGLFRSEFLYMDSSKLPTEEEQFEAYKSVALMTNNKDVIIRTLDIGGDKKLDYLELPNEENPFLGCRAIRLCLNNLDLFKTQLRAILRASYYGNLSIMFPMISSIGQLRDAKKVLEECKRELDKDKIPYNKEIKVGIMIEVPAAALNARNFAKECDFFSIGTNDLIQYTVAVERGNERISNLYTEFNPGVIRLIKMAIDGAHKEKIECGVCGEAASNELFVPLLIGLGLDEFSMSSNSILKTRKLISELDSRECKTLSVNILGLGEARKIKNKLSKFINK